MEHNIRFSHLKLIFVTIQIENYTKTNVYGTWIVYT
jgi:hypothetical protein